MKKDFEDFTKVLTWFQDTVSFDHKKEDLVSYSSGLISSKGRDEVNAETADTVGESIQTILDGLSFVDTISTKQKVKNLSSLKKGVEIQKQKVVSESLKLFTRLTIASQRDLTIKDSLGYELTTLPMSLFDEKQYMRKANKPNLGQYLKSFADPNPIPCNVNQLVIDGGWLLYQISFTTKQTFNEIALMFLNFVSSINRKSNMKITVVFDGYESSTKDHDHLRRTKTSCHDVNIKRSNVCHVPKKKLLSNTNNKSRFIDLLGEVFEENGIVVIKAVDDADTLIVKTAIAISINEPVQVKVEDQDTGVICMLVYHCSSTNNDIYFSSSQGSFSSKQIYNNLPEEVCRCLLFVHSFSGCDTVSSIFGKGKVAILKMFVQCPEEIKEVLTSLRSKPEDIKDAGVKVLQRIYGDKNMSLAENRYQRYNVMSAVGVITPERLPPTTGAAEQHSLRAYLQYHNWMLLNTNSLDIMEYGWKKENVFYTPIPTKEKIAPDTLLKNICCKCKEGDDACRNNKCSCWSYGFKCITACGNCHGMTCRNSLIDERYIDDIDDASDIEE